MKNFTETANYIIRKSENSSGFELLRKVGSRTMFLNRSQFQTPLVALANKLETRS